MGGGGVWARENKEGLQGRGWKGILTRILHYNFHGNFVLNCQLARERDGGVGGGGRVLRAIEKGWKES